MFLKFPGFPMGFCVDVPLNSDNLFAFGQAMTTLFRAKDTNSSACSFRNLSKQGFPHQNFSSKFCEQKSQSSCFFKELS